jgi:hypothetical protein
LEPGDVPERVRRRNTDILVKLPRWLVTEAAAEFRVELQRHETDYASRMSDRPATWPEWVGGIVFCAPWLGLSFEQVSYANDSHSALLGVGFWLLYVSWFVALAMVAPLVGHRRRHVFRFFIPIWGWQVPWTFGVRLVRLSQTGSWEEADAASELQRVV